MAAQRFRPFGVTDEEYTDLLVLQDGTPPPLRDALMAALYEAVTYVVGPYRFLNLDMAREIRALAGIELGDTPTGHISGEDVLRRMRQLTPMLMLRFADVVAYLYSGTATPVELRRIFEINNSKYTVAPDAEGHERLVERLPEGELHALLATFADAGPGLLLHRAFTAAYGISPNPGEAYKMSVKAVETALHQTIEPKNTGATLGTMLAVMRNAKMPWTLPLDERADHAGRNAETLIGFIQALWDGQEDRHRNGEVDLREARAAFHGAAAIVAWANEGLIAK
ncbi:hypothetical protein [Gryllotalpicola koreensis]|uniref:TIGR02391 family protein n=1 Tax=Gryllotalpicola koreensis TaxID=993086 RepID=A0ABP8A2T8_9MICO